MIAEIIILDFSHLLSPSMYVDPMVYTSYVCHVEMLCC